MNLNINLKLIVKKIQQVLKESVWLSGFESLEPLTPRVMTTVIATLK